MERETLIDEILALVKNDNSFLLNVRLYKQLNHDEYLLILQKLNQYYELIKDEETIDRRIAGIIYEIVEALVNYFEHLCIPSEYAEVQTIVNSSLDLMDRMFRMDGT